MTPYAKFILFIYFSDPLENSSRNPRGLDYDHLDDLINQEETIFD